MHLPAKIAPEEADGFPRPMDSTGAIQGHRCPQSFDLTKALCLLRFRTSFPKLQAQLLHVLLSASRRRPMSAPEPTFYTCCIYLLLSNSVDMCLKIGFAQIYVGYR